MPRVGIAFSPSTAARLLPGTNGYSFLYPIHSLLKLKHLPVNKINLIYPNMDIVFHGRSYVHFPRILYRLLRITSQTKERIPPWKLLTPLQPYKMVNKKKLKLKERCKSPASLLENGNLAASKLNSSSQLPSPHLSQESEPTPTSFHSPSIRSSSNSNSNAFLSPTSPSNNNKSSPSAFFFEKSSNNK